MARIVTQPLFVGLTTLELVIYILSVEYLARLGINDKDLAWANSPFCDHGLGLVVVSSHL